MRDKEIWPVPFCTCRQDAWYQGDTLVEVPSSQLEKPRKAVMLGPFPVGSSLLQNPRRLDFFLMLLVFIITFCIELLNISHQRSHLEVCPVLQLEIQ